MRRRDGHRRQVVMIGPSPGARGGMASVIQTYLAHGYADDGRCRFIATHCDGGAARKAALAAGALGRFLLLLATGRVALLHVHVASGTSFWRKALFIGSARLFRRPVLLHLHGGQFRDFIDRRLQGRRQRLALWLLGQSAAALALTDESVTWLRERAGIAQVECFPNPVGGTAPLPRQPGAPLRDILFLGRIEEEKGVLDLLRAFALVHARDPQTRLVLAGDGAASALAAVHALARTLDLEHALLLTGWIDAPARAQWLARAAVFALPSHHEQMPMALLEAMRAKVPVVATDVGCISHILNKGNCGFLVGVCKINELAASILCILDDNISAETASDRGLERIRSEYMVDTVIERLKRRYEELAA